MRQKPAKNPANTAFVYCQKAAVKCGGWVLKNCAGFPPRCSLSHLYTMVYDTNIHFIVFYDMDGSKSSEKTRIKSNAIWKSITVRDAVKFAKCDLYDGAAPNCYNEYAERLWFYSEGFDVEDDDLAGQYTYVDKKLPTSSINNYENISGPLVGPNWVILPVTPEELEAKYIAEEEEEAESDTESDE